MVGAARVIRNGPAVPECPGRSHARIEIVDIAHAIQLKKSPGFVARGE
jgi:hypothetical protein